MRNTKQEILTKSLELFAEKGYDGVSVREIAAAVGIRESALYKHYPGKQGIFDALFDSMQRRYEEAAAGFQLPLGAFPEIARRYAQNAVEEMQRLTEQVFRYWLHDAYASRFRRMLTIEQFKNTRAGAAYRSFFIEGVLSFQAGLFAEMMKQGFFEPSDPMLAAIDFYSPLFLLLARCDGQPDAEGEANRLLRLHVEGFAARHTAAPREKQPKPGGESPPRPDTTAL